MGNNYMFNLKRQYVLTKTSLRFTRNVRTYFFIYNYNFFKMKRNKKNSETENTSKKNY